MPFGYEIALFIAIGTLLIDLDHPIYVIFFEKIYTPLGFWKFHKKEHKMHRPHLYLFHLVEFNVLFLICSYFINYYLFLIAIGFVLHLAEDAVSYYLYYRP